MTKDEALKMAIKALQNISKSLTEKQVWFSSDVYDAMQACKEALEPTVAELNDEYLRDTHVEGLSTNSKANEIIKTKKPSYMYVYADGDFFIHSQSPIGAPAHWQYFGKIEVQDD